MPRITEQMRQATEMIRGASMRPGRNAPDNPAGGAVYKLGGHSGFNEAGAKCPG